MKKYEVVKDNYNFNNIINTGNKKSSPFFIIYTTISDNDYPTFGIAVGKKIGTAVERNYIKRQIRRMCDTNKFLFQNNTNYIIIVKTKAKDLKYSLKEKELQSLLEEEIK